MALRSSNQCLLASAIARQFMPHNGMTREVRPKPQKDVSSPRVHMGLCRGLASRFLRLLSLHGFN